MKLTPELRKRLGIKSQSKYRARRTEYNGVVYASKAEATRAAELDLMVRQGIILSWTPQPRFTLGCPENAYVADFSVFYPGPRMFVEDCKGMETPKFKRDKKLWKAYGKFPLRILKRKGNCWTVETIDPETKGGA